MIHVDKVSVLCEMDRSMMYEFSQRTAEALKDYTLFRLMLPPFQSFLDINVRKEVEKDRLVISCAASAQKTGKKLDDKDSARLLENAREIDQKFLQQAALFPITINIQYKDIEQIRKKRIVHLLEATYQLFERWENVLRFQDAVASFYSYEQFRIFLHEILHLYAMETKLLSNSVRVPKVFAVARDSLTQTIYSVMKKVAEDLAKELARKLYTRKIN